MGRLQTIREQSHCAQWGSRKGSIADDREQCDVHGGAVEKWVGRSADDREQSHVHGGAVERGRLQTTVRADRCARWGSRKGSQTCRRWGSR